MTDPSSEREYQNMSNAHIINLDGGIKPSLRRKDIKMITLLIGFVASVIYGWWMHRRAAR